MTVLVIVRIVSEHKYIKIYKYIYKYTIHTPSIHKHHNSCCNYVLIELQFIEDVLRMYCQLESHTCTHTVANTRAINIHKNTRHTYIHISGAYLGLTANIQVEAICNILTMSQTNSILDACGSPRYEPVYLATKYITKKK